jgi:hypothetical protein
VVATTRLGNVRGSDDFFPYRQYDAIDSSLDRRRLSTTLFASKPKESQDDNTECAALCGIHRRSRRG